MRNLLSIFGKKDELDYKGRRGILNEPGDRLEARITKSNRKVVKISKDKGNSKYSVVYYPDGTSVETRVRKKK